jgi:hypothetical protein
LQYEAERRDVYLPPGTKVQYGGYDDMGAEFGVVVHCWMDEEIHTYDCYVAFFGEEFPLGKPSEKPYILRYASISLKVIDQ